MMYLMKITYLIDENKKKEKKYRKNIGRSVDKLILQVSFNYLYRP